MSIHPVKSIRVKFIHKTFTRARLARRNTARHSWTAAGVLVPGLLLFGAITTSADHLEKHFKESMFIPSSPSTIPTAPSS